MRCWWVAIVLVVSGAARADCSLDLVAETGLRDTDGFLSIAVLVAGRPVSMLLDTGSDAGLLSVRASRGLAVEPAHVARVSGTGGEVRGGPVANGPTRAMGGLSVSGLQVPIGALPAFPRITPPIEGLIGGDLLSHFEVEIDVRDGVFRLYQAHGLSSLCRGLPPWRGPVDEVALTRLGNRMTLAATLNRRPISALLDSGARSRIVSRSAALAAGVDAATLDAEPGGITSGIDGRNAIYHWHRFETLAIGTERHLRPVLTVTPLRDQADMLLGADWFERHLVWISYGTSRLFTQPVDQR